MSPKKVGIQSFQLSMHDVGVSLPSKNCKNSLKVLQIPGFGRLITLKVLQIPAFGRLVALKVLQIPAFGGVIALKML